MYVCIHLRIVHIERVLYVNIVLLYAAVIVQILYAAVTYYTVIVTSVWMGIQMEYVYCTCGNLEGIIWGCRPKIRLPVNL